MTLLMISLHPSPPPAADCQPPCHNRGSCSRPHTCVCRSGFQGARCEEAAPEQVYIHTGGSLRRIQPGTNPFQREHPRRRPTERQQTGTSRTVKRYQSSTGPITSNALPLKMQLFSRAALLLFTQVSVCLCAPGANLTSNLDRIKIVFTPMVCRRVCSGGRCYNSCEKGDTTTVYSENQQQHQPAKTQGFRLFFCQIPCLNGGRCIGRDQCWCPTNSTGKFCHLPAPPPARPTPRKDGSLAGRNSSSHSMYTLPLSNQQASLHPSLVNVHIQHPHEAEVQIHQVARVKPGQRPPAAEGAHSVQQRSQPGNGMGNGHGHTRPHNRQNGYVGRCFQETVDGQCGKPLPGLTKQDDCCGSVGASWGLNKCTECPTKPAYAVIANGQVECPKGYKRMNMTHCQDINECLINGICKNAECLNTRGSYRCTCKPGYMLDPARSHCVSDKAVSDQRGMCYRSASAGTCSLPLTQHITKQICCCSRVGKAWGTACERCPLPDTDHFKEICPAGHGYTYSRSDVQISLRQLEEEELRRTGVSWEAQNPSHPQLPQQPAQPPQQLPHVPQIPQYPYHRQPQHPQHPRQPQHPQYTQEIPQTPHQCQYLLTDIDKCSITPTICGHGLCVPVQTGYTCYCDPGYKLSALQTNCIDVNECEGDPCGGKGHCVNTFGSYACHCYSGYSQVITQNRKFCQDINECDMANKCQDGDCVNTEGSYTCECKSGYTKSWKGQCEDVDECQGPSSCPSGRCVNTPGSFQCQACGPGFRAASGRCLDVNECLDQSVCAHGRCVNSEGSYSCNCYQGYQASPDNSSCQDVDECLLPGACLHGRCVNLDGSHRCSCNPGYQTTPDSRACEDIDECQSGSVCANGICLNSEGSFSCITCPSGYSVSLDGELCEDIDECELPTTCPRGTCTNTEGSFTCTTCGSGYRVTEDGLECDGESWTDFLYGDCLNTEGSYLCICPDGYTTGITDGIGCQDVDECSKDGVCSHGQCLNTDGSYICLCEAGFKYSTDTADCEDQNECKEFGSSVCGTWRCENTIGSYRCFMGCQPGLYGQDNPDCDIDECVNETICGDHGFCENTDGSYRCQCDQGYTNPPGDCVCVYVNECEMSTALCGEALCENVDGSFLCICPSDNEEFDPITSQCRPQASPTEEQRKECYYNLNDANFCDNVLSRNTTKQECCCTVGAGWGDDCEIHPCPEYDKLCPHGSGLLPQAVSSQSLEQQRFKGTLLPYVDECKMFGPDICKNGRCSNNFSSYSCFCRTGFYYDNIRLECVDYDECLTEKACVDGVCVNTAGSFDCFCSPPLVLDTTRRRCVSTHEPEEDIHLDICWQGLVDESMCAQPLIGRRTTYTECCCLYGVAWSEQCAFLTTCDRYLCNLPRRGGSDSLRERPGYEYGPGVEGPEGPYVHPYWDNYGRGPITGPGGTYYNPEDTQGIPLFTDNTNDYGSREGAIEPPLRVPVHRPREFQPRPVDSYNDRFDGFEGLRAEECGILNGCENGRCVRVREGYTCDCFDGYELDLTKMACIDINECEDISDNVALCKNGACTNTEGSYKCTCLPGFQASAKPHECIPEVPVTGFRERVAGK
uniref:Latent-transforming growth factor beta-binding protein 1 n=1 Tax=Hucho hucho TaxID=62062 RepID=A0A4W5QM39_9TELE